MRFLGSPLPAPAALFRCWLLVAVVAAASASVAQEEDEEDPLPPPPSSSAVGADIAVDTVTTLECHRREYSFRATRTDANGNRCWDDIVAMSCWGRCDSGEIADWRFPFKRSFHPVCTYDSRKLVRTQLRFCDPADVDEENELRTYEFYEALSCSCQVCDSTWTSCEGFRHP